MQGLILVVQTAFSNCLTADRLSSNIKFNVRLPLSESPARALLH